MGRPAIITAMKFEVTPEFVERYESLDEAQVQRVDGVIRRLLASPGSAWARQHRVVGENGSAWLVSIRGDGQDFALYWQEKTSESLVLLLLLDR
jgi:hypothetical protein